MHYLVMKDTSPPINIENTGKALNKRQVRKVESFMLIHNLKLTKSDISLAARKSNVSISRAFAHFHELNKKLTSKNKENGKKLVDAISKIERRISKMKDRINRME